MSSMGLMKLREKSMPVNFRQLHLKGVKDVPTESSAKNEVA